MNTSLARGWIAGAAFSTRRDRPLTTTPCYQFSERRITSKLPLFRIKTFDTNNEGNRLSISSNHDSFALRFINTSIKVRLFYPITFI